MEHSLKLFLPKLLLITPLVALQPLNAQSVNNPYTTYYAVLNNSLYLPNHPNLSLLSTIPLLNSSQSVPLTEIEIKPVIKQPKIPLADARFNQWGEAGLILGGRYPEKILPPSPEFSMVFPLFQEVDRFLLTQLSARRNDLYGKQTAYSLGFGQRFWPLDQHHWWGTHLFYDHCPQGKHHRLGLVGEWQNSRARCTVNGYFPLSQWRLDKQNQLEKRPARSLDFRLQWFLFQKPCVNLNVLIEHAFSHSLSYPNQSAAHPTALMLGLNYTPVSLITIGYDAKMAHKEKPSHQLQIQFTYRLGIPLAQQFNPALATTGYDPATNRLSLIHRQSIMLLEQREIPPAVTPLVPPTPAEETEQKPSEDTPQASHHAEDLDASEEVGTVQQKPADKLDRQKSNDTVANPAHQRIRLVGNPSKPTIYPTLSPLTTPEVRELSREQKDTSTHLSPIQPHPSITDKKDFAEALNPPDQEVNTEQQKPNNSADKPDYYRASLVDNTPKPANHPKPSQLNFLEEREAPCEQKAVLFGNLHSLNSPLGAGRALDTTTQSGIRPHAQTTEGNRDQVLSQDSDSRTSSSQTNPSLVRQPNDPEMVHLSQETSASWAYLGTQEIDQQLNSDNRADDCSEETFSSGTNIPNNPPRDFLPESSKHDDTTKIVQPSEDHERSKRIRKAPNRLYSPGFTDRKTKTTYAEKKKWQKTMKTKDQPPQDSDLLTTQTSLGDEEPTEQPQKLTTQVFGPPGSPNTSSLTGPNLLHNNRRFSSLDYSVNKSPSTQTPEFGGGQSTAQPTRQTTRQQKPRILYTPPSNHRSQIRNSSR